MNTIDEIMVKIRGWEKERDRCIAIKCTHVAAKFQRMIDKAVKEMDEEKRSGNGDKG